MWRLKSDESSENDVYVRNEIIRFTFLILSKYFYIIFARRERAIN